MEKLDHGLNEEQIQLVSRQTIEALNYCHSIGVIHRDLKAGNILLMKDGSVKVNELRDSLNFDDCFVADGLRSFRIE